MIGQTVKKWVDTANAWPKRKAQRDAMKSLLPAVILAPSHSIVFEGKTFEGPLVADDDGVGVQAIVSDVVGSRGIEHFMVKRIPFVRWSSVVSYRIAAAPAPATKNESSNNETNDVILTLTDDARTWSVTLPDTSVETLTAELGKWLTDKEST